MTPRRARAWIGPCIALLLAACVSVWSRTFPGLEPVSPAVQLSGFPQVDGLQPDLRWKPAKAPGVAYDLVIWESGLDPDRAEPGAPFQGPRDEGRPRGPSRGAATAR